MSTSSSSAAPTPSVDQLQHRVSAVYLREFGFEEGGQWKIATAELDKVELMHRVGRMWTAHKSIDSVTVELNEFDMMGANPDLRKMLEEEFGKVETRYPAIIAELHGGTLSNETAVWLQHLMGSLLIRSRRFREMVDWHLRQPHANKFLRDMCWLMTDEQVEATVKAVEAVPIEHRLNHALVLVWNQIGVKLTSFHSVILKDYDNSGWQTNDDPVMLMHNMGNGTFMSINTEIYFPLSRDFCLFMYHPKAPGAPHPLRKCADLSFWQANEWIRHMVSERVWGHADKMVFFPTPIKLREALN